MAAFITPVRPAPIAAIAPVTIVTPITVVTPTVLPPAVVHLDDAALGYRRSIDRHGGGRRNGSKGRAKGNGCGQKNVSELHIGFLIDDEATLHRHG